MDSCRSSVNLARSLPRRVRILASFTSFLPVVVFHIYMNGRLAGDLWPYVQEMWSVARSAVASGGQPNEAAIEAIMKEVQAVQAGYGSWALMRQALLLISLPLGVGSLAYVYEDIFGPKK